MKNDNISYLTILHRLLANHFNLEEIRTLCFNLHVDYESVPGAENRSIIRELMLCLARNGRLPELITLAQQQRPLVAWPPYPNDFHLPEALAMDSNTMPSVTKDYYGDIVHGDKVGGAFIPK